MKGKKKVSIERLTFVFLRQRERLRYRETLRSLNAFRSSLKLSLGNFLKAYWYLWAASFIFPFWRTHGVMQWEQAGHVRGEKQGKASTGYSCNSCSLAQAIPSHRSYIESQNTHMATPDLSFQPQNSIINHGSLVGGAEHAHLFYAKPNYIILQWIR